MLVGELDRVGIRSAVIKHDGHEFEADVPGTDSRRIKEAGAYGTVVYSGTKFSMTKEQPSMKAEDFFGFFPEADIIFLEGQKDSDYPKLEVLRRKSQMSRCAGRKQCWLISGAGRLPGVGRTPGAGRLPGAGKIARAGVTAGMGNVPYSQLLRKTASWKS